MKVTIISDIPLSRKNGTAVAAANLIESLRAKGHEVRVVCPDCDIFLWTVFNYQILMVFKE